VVLPLCWYALAAGVFGLDSINVKEPYAIPQEPEHCRGIVDKTLVELKGLLKPYWRCFQ
jgi:hypothetical protein